MAKLRETEILTNKVYLNIEKNDGTVDTISLSTEQSLADYGELEVLAMGEPRYGNESRDASGHHGRRKSSKKDDGKREGVTNIVLQQK